jgi:hypothetical protein
VHPVKQLAIRIYQLSIWGKKKEKKKRKGCARDTSAPTRSLVGNGWKQAVVGMHSGMGRGIDEIKEGGARKGFK